MREGHRWDGRLVRMLLQGLFVPLACPFTRRGAVFPEKLESNVRRYSLAPIAGLLVLPPGGEADGLTDAEMRKTFEIVAGAAAEEKVLLAGVQRGSVRAALEIATAAYDAGMDAVVLAPPPPWARLVRGDDARELVAFYQCFADSSPLPVILLSDAAPPSFALPLPLAEDMARHPNVLGLLDFDLTPERLANIRTRTAGVRREVIVTPVFEAVTRRMLVTMAASAVTPTQETTNEGAFPIVQTAPAPALKTRTRVVGFQVLSAGPAHAAPPMLEAGLAGMAPALAAAAPQGCFEVYAAWKDGDPALSAERATRLAGGDAVIAALGPAGLKHACDWNAYFGGLPRLPRLMLTATERKQVEDALGDVRN